MSETESPPKFAVGLILTAGLVVVFASLASFAAPYFWLLDVATHFRAFYAGFLMFAFLVALFHRRWAWSATFALIMILNVLVIYPYYADKPEIAIPKNAPIITVLTLNLQEDSRAYRQVLDVVQETAADILVFQEVNPNWVTMLMPLIETHPHHITVPLRTRFGLGLYSRFPIKSETIYPSGSEDYPTLAITVDVGGRNLTVFNVHLAPPVTPRLLKLRNLQLDMLAVWVKKCKDATILAGDMNISPFSPFFGYFLKESGLQDTMLGEGHQPTWPARPWPFWFMRIPIDHILISSGIYAIDRWRPHAVGSDHFPVVARLALL